MGEAAAEFLVASTEMEADMKAARRRIKFFADKAGYVAPRGRLVCAMSVADAELFCEPEPAAAEV